MGALFITKEERQELKKQRQRENAIAAMERARQRQQAKAIEKRDCPIEREKRIQKANEYRDRAITKARQRARLVSEGAKVLPAPKRPQKASRGLKGRMPSVSEKRIMDKIGKLPCIACLVHGRESPVISLHHTDGRTTPNAHKKVLPLCACHHNVAADGVMRRKYPDLIPIHAQGSVGGKAAWEIINGTQSALLAEVYRLIAVDMPEALL